MARDYYLSNREVVEFEKRTETAWLGADRTAFNRLFKHWQDFRTFLQDALDAEVSEYAEHPEAYFMSLDEVQYVAHWRRQLANATRLIQHYNDLKLAAIR